MQIQAVHSRHTTPGSPAHLTSQKEEEGLMRLPDVWRPRGAPGAVLAYDSAQWQLAPWRDLPVPVLPHLANLKFLRPPVHSLCHLATAGEDKEGRSQTHTVLAVFASW